MVVVPGMSYRNQSPRAVVRRHRVVRCVVRVSLQTMQVETKHDRRPGPTVVSFRMERTGLEPVTCCLQSTISTSSTTSDAGKITVLTL